MCISVDHDKLSQDWDLFCVPSIMVSLFLVKFKTCTYIHVHVRLSFPALLVSGICLVNKVTCVVSQLRHRRAESSHAGSHTRRDNPSKRIEYVWVGTQE